MKHSCYKPIPFIIFVYAVIFLSTIRPERYDGFTYNDLDNLLLWTTRSFEDGTILLNFMKFINMTCMEPIFYYRIIHLNGSIVPLTITIPNIEEFNFCVGNYGPGPVYNTHT